MPLPWLVPVVTALRVLREAEDWEVRVDWDILEFRGPCPFILVGKGSLEARVVVGPRCGGAVYMRPCADNSIAAAALRVGEGCGTAMWGERLQAGTAADMTVRMQTIVIQV